MAWIDDRVWCHPKLADLTDKAYRTYINSIAYSCGLRTQGHLTAGQQHLIGSTGKARDELINAGLWEPNGDGSSIDIHDWAEHNEARERHRERERQRLREYRRQRRTDTN